MRQVILRVLVMTAVLAVVLGGGHLGAGGSARGQQEPAARVFTAPQAAAGKVVFEKTCAGCHLADLSGKEDAPPLAGSPFVSTWQTRSTKDLLDYISTAMPPGGPALTPDEYASIVARVLQVNGADAGTQALSASTVVPIGSVTSAP
jgi:mono/diheme cytochrome c family protein